MVCCQQEQPYSPPPKKYLKKTHVVSTVQQNDSTSTVMSASCTPGPAFPTLPAFPSGYRALLPRRKVVCYQQEHKPHPIRCTSQLPTQQIVNVQQLPRHSTMEDQRCARVVGKQQCYYHQQHPRPRGHRYKGGSLPPGAQPLGCRGPVIMHVPRQNDGLQLHQQPQPGMPPIYVEASAECTTPPIYAEASAEYHLGPVVPAVQQQIVHVQQRPTQQQYYYQTEGGSLPPLHHQGLQGNQYRSLPPQQREYLQYHYT